MMRRVALIAIVTLHIHAAQAHMHDRPDLDTWFGGLENQQKHGCCAYTEGVALATDEVRTTEIDQCRDDYAMDRQPNLPAHYCVRISKESGGKFQIMLSCLSRTGMDRLSSGLSVVTQDLSTFDALCPVP